LGREESNPNTEVLVKMLWTVLVVALAAWLYNSTLRTPIKNALTGKSQ